MWRGNEANFFVRDATGGNRLPFRIQPGAPTNTIYMSSSGNVGMGTSSPGYDLEIEHITDTVKLGLTNSSQDLGAGKRQRRFPSLQRHFVCHAGQSRLQCAG